MTPRLHLAPRDALQLADPPDRPHPIHGGEAIEAEDLAAAILAHASGAVRWYAEDARIGVHGRDGVRIGVHGTNGARVAQALAATPFRGAEKPLLMTYAFNERRDAERVVYFAGLCRVPAPVAKFALAKLVQPTRFAAGDFAECRPKGRRADIDFEIRRADQLFRQWLRDAALAFLLVYAIEARPQTCGEIQNSGIRQSESESEATAQYPVLALKES